jgi:hypothetical protein
MTAYNTSPLIPDSYQDGGNGFIVGGIANFPMTIPIRTEFNLIYRAPANTSEIAIGANFLSRSGGSVYFEGGLHLGFPLVNFDYEDRSAFDFGPALGFGFNVNEDFALGLRFFYAVTDFGKSNDNRLFQFELGLSYMF